MRFDPERDQLFDEALSRLPELPPGEGLEILLQFFLSLIEGTDPQTAREMRDELLSCFGGRFCSNQICCMMAELVNGHLAARAPH